MEELVVPPYYTFLGPQDGEVSLSLKLTSYGRRQTATYGTEMFVSLESMAKDSTSARVSSLPTPGSPTPRAAAVINPTVSNFQ